MPALLHLALFLFLAGLVEFFFQTHIVVAYVTLAAVVVVSTAYGALTLMPLVITSTPYQTPLSLRLPRTFEPLKLRLQRRPWMKQQRDRPFQYAEAMEKISALRQSRALQWLLDRMRGAESFDRFVEGIEPFLGAAEQSTRIVFQLNVNTDPEGRRRCLSAHIGHRLHLCLDTSIAIDTRRSQVKSMAGALWSLLIRVHAGDMDNDIAPGGTDDTSEWRPVSQHLQQWLHPYILRSLRRLRQDPDPFISLYSICTSIVILVHTARLLATAMLQKGDITVPHGWGFIQLLEAYDSGVTYEAVEMSFELDVLVECLLGPPRDEMGQRSRAEENLSRFSNARGFVPKSSFDFSALGSSPSKDVEHLDTKAVSNSCHLAALCAFLEHLTTKTRDLHPTPTVIDLIQRTFRLLAVNTSAENSDRTIQRSFNTNLERVFHSHYYADPRAEILGGRATFLHEEIRGITALISKTLDHPVWSRNAGIVAFGITSYVRADELVLLDSGSGRMGDVVFDGKPLIPSAEYTICTADRYDGLDLSGSDNTSVLIFALHGGHNQKWQLLQNGQYWSLRNAQTGTFLGIESDLGSICDSTAVCASNEAIAWDIRIEPDTSQYCLYYAGTEYAIARGSDNKVRSYPFTRLGQRFYAKGTG
ncbi:hypothetical protein BXZ70DRAFT_336708 [Cristinia sonorae]|uniref:Ricin B lectin domain-containing protein n=1 Tax=Cristinia sonorae TaxID=1940300 RepID=A0A8K0XNK6_9AGAR|nr:hypothetical protein BXZ70DRAFT_336708 [Cristinia sonorae]